MKLLKEPMLHFLIAGALLFAGDALLNRHDGTAAKIEPIRIGEGEIRWLQETFANQWQRPPSGDELNELVENLLEEELLAREARAFGLDQGDTVVRRRLAQKLGFLVEGTSEIAEPTENELRQFYSANLALYQTEPQVSFTQIFFSTERRQHPESDAQAALISLSTVAEGNPAVLGDSLLLEDRFQDVDRSAVSSMFGADFADAVFGLEPGPWHGPIKSSFGLHLVEVQSIQAAEIRPFESVRAVVAQEWRRHREDEIKRSYIVRLREKYGVVIDDGVASLLAHGLAGKTVQ
jgi:hypothetical protein